MKTICLFCGKSHKKPKPKICQAKGDVMRSYLKTLPMWKVMHAVENGLINLQAEAEAILKRSAK